MEEYTYLSHGQEEGMQFELNKNEVILLRAGKSHKGYKMQNQYVSYYRLHFQGDCDNLCLKSNITYQILPLLKELISVTKLPDYPLKALNHLTSLIIWKLQYQNSHSQSALPIPLLKMMDYVKSNLNERLTVFEVAEHFGYNANYISRLYKEHCTQSLQSFMHGEKIKQINHLLMSTDLTLKEIAIMTGFDDYHAFLKFYVYSEHITPTQVREQ